MHDDIGDLHRLHCADGEKARIAGASPDKDDAPARVGIE
jgi:hypothetical protein